MIINIYKITNILNGITYIGQTKLEVNERLLVHFKYAKEGRDGDLYEDIRKQEFKNFKIEKIDECFERHKFIIEKHFIEKEKKSNICYNDKLGSQHADSTKKKLQIARKNNNKFDYSSNDFKQTMSKSSSGEGNGMYGKSNENAPNGRMVLVYNNNRELINSFNSVKMSMEWLKKEVGKCHHAGINNAARNGTEYKGYYWEKEFKK